MPGRILYRDAQGGEAFVDVPDNAAVFMGRGADCQVRTDDSMASRKNCKISFVGGRPMVEDLGSSNGTFITGQDGQERRIQKQQLTHGDIIRCASLQVRFIEVAAQPEVVQPQVQVGVDPGALQAQQAQLEQLTAEREAASKKAREATAELESLRSRLETTENELKMLRAQGVGARDELASMRRELASDKEELQAVSRSAEELRVEVRKLRDENNQLKQKNEELVEEKASSTRQFERLQEDVQRTRQTTEELRNKLAELQKTKDEGWRELNAQLSQIEQLREVITEQERLLEERRVGLIALESAVKDVRTEKEKVLREFVDVKSQRDDLKERLQRADTKVEGLEEEHRRLARMMASQGGGGPGAGEDFARMAAEVRELKIENRKLEQQLTRFKSEAERATKERTDANEELAHLEVTKRELQEEKRSMEAARDRAEERLARAEAARQRLEEEKLAAGQARDAALASAHDVRHLHDRALRRIAELEKAVSSGGGGVVDGDAVKRAEAARDEALLSKARAEARLTELERQFAEVRGDLARARAAGVSATSEDATPHEGTAMPDVNQVHELKAKAEEVYEGINEALSSLRTVILTAKGLFMEVRESVADQDARKALGDAIAESMSRTEDAKGTLRALRELIQS